MSCLFGSSALSLQAVFFSSSLASSGNVLGRCLRAPRAAQARLGLLLPLRRAVFCSCVGGCRKPVRERHEIEASWKVCWGCHDRGHRCRDGSADGTGGHAGSGIHVVRWLSQLERKFQHLELHLVCCQKRSLQYQVARPLLLFGRANRHRKSCSLAAGLTVTGNLPAAYTNASAYAPSR